MSQHDFDIANQTASNARTDINNALKALASCSSGGTAPTTTYANMLWYDTTNNILKMRNEADSAWINVLYLDQGGSQAQIFDDTKVVNTSGTQTGLIGDQSASVWQTGTGTTESLVSPAKVKAAIDANVTPGAPIMSVSTGTSIPIGGYVLGIDDNYFNHNLGSTFSAATYKIRVFGGTGQFDITYGNWIYLGREGGNTVLYQRIS